MANKIITALFTKNSVPQTGLTPTMDIWELHPTNPLLNVLVVSGGATTEIGGGWYRYDFVTYDNMKNYVMLFDGGISLPTEERYKPAANESYAEEVWEEQGTAHLNADTMGLLQNQIAADAAQVRIDMTTAISIVTTLLQYQTNRTKIDKVAKTLTIYDDLGTTPIKVFDLKDSTGALSVTEVCERMPQP